MRRSRRQRELEYYRRLAQDQGADIARLRAVITYAVGELVPGVSPHGVLSDALTPVARQRGRERAALSHGQNGGPDGR